MTLGKSFNAAALAVAATLLFTGTAVAGDSVKSDRPADFEELVPLHPTEIGAALNAQGIAFRGRTSGVEKFAIRVFGEFRNGTVLVVEVDKGSSRVIAGSITVLLGSGSLELDSRQGSPVFPVEEVEHVTIRFSGGTVLEGRFQSTK